MLLSVIVPVFNTEKYIKKCLDSIINQTYEELEIILIDDGSIDASGEVCDEYAKKDKRVRVCHKENEGVVLARKTGVELAKGKVITFVDSDDWIESEMYQEMMKIYEKEQCDMLTSGLNWDSGNETNIMLDGIGEGVYGRKDILDFILLRAAGDPVTKKQGITASVCNKLFKKSLLKDALEEMDTELVVGEDGAVVYPLITSMDKIVVIGHAWYHYVQHIDSRLHTAQFNLFESIYRLKKYLLNQTADYKIMHRGLEIYVKGFLYWVIRDIYGLDLKRYLFPYEVVERGSKVILYGAGNVGQSYSAFIEIGKWVEIMAWVDKNYLEYRECGYDVQSPEIIANIDYDMIIIAVAEKESALMIRNKLLECGVEDEKIIWKECIFL